jgi:hypothetical protein
MTCYPTEAQVNTMLFQKGVNLGASAIAEQATQLTGGKPLLAIGSRAIASRAANHRAGRVLNAFNAASSAESRSADAIA